jgi:hypothetical protein
MRHSVCTRNMTPFSLFPFGFRLQRPSGPHQPPTGVISPCEEAAAEAFSKVQVSLLRSHFLARQPLWPTALKTRTH